MKFYSAILSALVTAGLFVGCSTVPENVKMGIVKLDAAAKLMSLHNAAHCEYIITKFGIAFAEMTDTDNVAVYDGNIWIARGFTKIEIANQISNEREYHRANILLPETTEELRAWAFEEEIEGEND